MTSQTSPSGSSPSSGSRPRPWWVAAVLLLLIGAGFFTVGQFGHQNPSTGPAASSQLASRPAGHPGSTQPAAPFATRSGRPSAAAAALVPVSLRIPAMGVSVSLSQLGLNPDKTVQVPTEYQKPGWYKLGPAPGQMGSAVILGHVDDKTGPAVFYKLKTLKAGDTVDVSLAGGAVAHFVVTTVTTYTKTQFPTQKVYASRGYSALQLVTCGGAFDRTTGHYLSNVVAYTTLVSTTPAGEQ